MIWRKLFEKSELPAKLTPVFWIKTPSYKNDAWYLLQVFLFVCGGAIYENYDFFIYRPPQAPARTGRSTESKCCGSIPALVERFFEKVIDTEH